MAWEKKSGQNSAGDILNVPNRRRREDKFNHKAKAKGKPMPTPIIHHKI